MTKQRNNFVTGTETQEERRSDKQNSSEDVVNLKKSKIYKYEYLFLKGWNEIINILVT
jgi:hypothetical protein